MGIDISKIKDLNSAVRDKAKSENSWLKAILIKEIVLFKPRLSDSKKEAFFSELNTLLTSGIDMKTALEIICEEFSKKKERVIFDKIRERVINGENLSKSIKESNMFTPYEYFSLKIAEETGRITEILQELSTFLIRKIKQRRQVTSALSYPVLVMITAVTSVVFMLIYIVPMFQDVYKRFNGEMPAVTKFVISLSGFISDYLWVLLLMILFVFISSKVFGNNNWYKEVKGKITLGFPMIGTVTRKVYLARFCQAMSFLLTSRIPMLKSLEMVRDMIGFYPMEQALLKIESDVMSGKSLNESMKQFPIFDKRFISLVKVGEEANKLDEIFIKMNRQYAEDVEHKLAVLSSLLEPVLIIFVGGIVGFILISMYMPLFSISTGIYGL